MKNPESIAHENPRPSGRLAATLDGYGLAVTGEEAVGFGGWSKMHRDFQRWNREAPGLLENAIAWRLDALDRGAFKGPEAGHDAQAAFIHAGLELALAVKYGDTVHGPGGAT